MKKYPLTWLFTFEMIILFGGIALWSFLDYFQIFNDLWSPIYGGCLGVLSFIWLVVIFKYWNKLWGIEKKTRIKKFKLNIPKKKNILLLAQRNIFANISLCFGAIAVCVFWLFLFPSPELSDIGFWIARIVSILWFFYGLIFSFFRINKYVIYSQGNLTIKHNNGKEIVSILQIKQIIFEQEKNGKDGLRPINAKIILNSDKILKCINVDKVMYFSEKFEALKKYVDSKVEEN